MRERREKHSALLRGKKEGGGMQGERGSGYTSRRDKAFTWAAALQDAELVGEYQFPCLRKTEYIPRRLLSFNELLRRKERRLFCGHFFIDDYQFERLW